MNKVNRMSIRQFTLIIQILKKAAAVDLMKITKNALYFDEIYSEIK